MHHQYRDSDLLEVFGEIGLREGDDSVVVRLRAAHHALTPPVLDDGLRGLRARAVVAVEGTRSHIAIEAWAIGGGRRLKVVEYLFRQTVRIGIRPSLNRPH